MATPTIEKEFFFEYNHVQKINITCEFVSEFEFFIFWRPGGDRSIDRSPPGLRKKRFWHRTVSTRVKNWAMSKATPTIEKEFFFEYNHVQKINITCEFVSEFELFIFRRPGGARPSEDPNQNVNFFESVSKNWCVRCPSTYQHHHRSIKYQALR